ncbi:MAG: TRAP transporter small permease [Paracoccaceae bacterium]
MTQTNETTNPMIRFCHGTASFALVVMMLVVVGDVLLRALFNHPVRGAYDVVAIALLIMVFAGIAPVIAARKEILIDLIDPLVPRRALQGLGLVSTLLSVGVFGFIGWSMWGPARDAYRYGDRSLELGLPVWVLWALAFAGLVGILWALTLQMRAGLRTPADMPDEEGGL